jgi:hypothetical protein
MNRRSHLMGLGVSRVGLAAGNAAQGRPAQSPGRMPPLTPLQWVTPRVEGPGLSFHTFRSQAAGTVVSFHIYAPPAYAADPNRRFP